MTDENYENELPRLQLALVEAQVAASQTGARTAILFEGRDGAGKDGAIKRIVEHLSVRSTRVIALPKPSDRDRTQWYFQRYVGHLPAAGDFVIFNRSWYNRSGVETVMNFATEAEREEFFRSVPSFEQMLADSGIRLIKFWLDISRDEQSRRLKERRTDPLKQLKVSDMDLVAQERWHAYSEARDEMLMRTHTSYAPWHCVKSDRKKDARIAILRHLARELAPEDVAANADSPDPEVLFAFQPEMIREGRLFP